jgi:hypothetical protein
MYQQRFTIVFTGKGWWLNGLSPDEKGALFLTGALVFSLVALFLMPLVVFRYPYVTVDGAGVRAFVLGRRRISWDHVASISFTTHFMRFHPLPNDPDRREMQVSIKLIDREGLIEAIHAHRPDLVPIPRSIVRARQRQDRARQPVPTPIRYDPKAWMG